MTDIDTIIEAVTAWCDTTIEEMRSASRMPGVIKARMLVAFLARRHTVLSYPKIAKALLGTSFKHTSVMRMYERMDESLLADETGATERELNDLTELILNAPRKATSPVISAGMKIRLLADAVFVTDLTGSDKRSTSPILIKCVLMAIAGHENNPISLRGIEARCNIASNTAWKGVRALLTQGAIVKVGSGLNRAARYRVSWERLAELATKEPTHDSGGYEPIYHDDKHIKARDYDRFRRRRNREVAA